MAKRVVMKVQMTTAMMEMTSRAWLRRPQARRYRTRATATLMIPEEMYRVYWLAA